MGYSQNIWAKLMLDNLQHQHSLVFFPPNACFGYISGDCRSLLWVFCRLLISSGDVLGSKSWLKTQVPRNGITQRIPVLMSLCNWKMPLVEKSKGCDFRAVFCPCLPPPPTEALCKFLLLYVLRKELVMMLLSGLRGQGPHW